jgi:hypothetical protein
MNVPRIVARIVARNATSRVSLSYDDRTGNEKRFRHASSDACSHLMLYLPAGVLNAKMIITAIGMIRYRMNSVVYVGRMNRVHFLLDGVLGGGPRSPTGSPIDPSIAERFSGRMVMPTPPRP